MYWMTVSHRRCCLDCQLWLICFSLKCSIAGKGIISDRLFISTCDSSQCLVHKSGTSKSRFVWGQGTAFLKNEKIDQMKACVFCSTWFYTWLAGWRFYVYQIYVTWNYGHWIRSPYWACSEVTLSEHVIWPTHNLTQVWISKVQVFPVKDCKFAKIKHNLPIDRETVY